MIYREQNTQRALSPTSITIADYVINPYGGCDFNCVYCYGKMNNTYRKKKVRLGGDYVEYKPNFLDVLKKEVAEKKPSHVLIGSTTEVYQHIEKKKEMTRRVLTFLNEANISYTILTKSPLVERDIDLIREHKKNEVYVTINTLDDTVRKALEPQSSSIEQRSKAIQAVHEAGIRVIIHAGPYIPELSNYQKIITTFAERATLVEFENLNLKMAEKEEVSEVLRRCYPKVFDKITAIYASKPTYEAFYAREKEAITQYAKKCNVSVRFFFYPFDSFYNNVQAY